MISYPQTALVCMPCMRLSHVASVSGLALKHKDIFPGAIRVQLDPLVSSQGAEVKCETFLSRLCRYRILCSRHIVVADHATFHPSRFAERTHTQMMAL